MNILPAVAFVLILGIMIYGLWYVSRDWPNTIPAGGLNNGKPKV